MTLQELIDALTLSDEEYFNRFSMKNLLLPVFEKHLLKHKRPFGYDDDWKWWSEESMYWPEMHIVLDEDRRRFLRLVR